MFPKNALQLALVASVAVFWPLSAQGAAPDLCADLVLSSDGAPYSDSAGLTLSKWCEPRVDPPAYDDDVCCVVTDEANCVPTDEVGRCSIGMKFSCEFGEQVGGAVVCYQPGPSACALGFCVDGYDPGLEVWASTEWLCCTTEDGMTGSCTHAATTPGNAEPNVECGGYLAVCNWGVTHLDGTVECLG